ncbi:MAG TPA: hypothetical protein VGK20_12395 [Candidatus Binatia bacterium]|jgi:hypothetical protein
MQPSIADAFHCDFMNSPSTVSPDAANVTDDQWRDEAGIDATPLVYRAFSPRRGVLREREMPPPLVVAELPAIVVVRTPRAFSGPREFGFSVFL